MSSWFRLRLWRQNGGRFCDSGTMTLPRTTATRSPSRAELDVLPSVLAVHDRVVHRDHVGVVVHGERRAGRAAGVAFAERAVVSARATSDPRCGCLIVSRVSTGIRGRSSRPRNFAGSIPWRSNSFAVVRHVFVGVTHDARRRSSCQAPMRSAFPPLALLQQCLEFRESSAVALAIEPRAESRKQQVLQRDRAPVVESLEGRIHRDPFAIARA